MATPTRDHGTATGAILTTATLSVDVDCSGSKSLTVIWRLDGTVTVGDMTPYVNVYYDSVALPGEIVNSRAISTAVSGANVYATRQYDINGYDKLLIVLRNNNAGTLTGNIWFWLGS